MNPFYKIVLLNLFKIIKLYKMSTTFGIELPEGNYEMIRIAHRTNGEIIWLNNLASILPNDTEVVPLDNSAQGIHTIGDLRTFNKKQDQDQNPLLITHSPDMVDDQYSYKDHFKFQRLRRFGKWFVTYKNTIITFGLYRHDLEEWIDIYYK